MSQDVRLPLHWGLMTPDGEQPRPLALWPPFVVFGIALVVITAAGTVVSLVAVGSKLAAEGVDTMRGMSFTEVTRHFIGTPAVILASVAISDVVLLILALLAARRSGQGLAAGLRLRTDAGITPLYLVLATLALLAISDLSDRVITLSGAAEVSVIGMIGSAIGAASWPAFALLTLLVTTAGVSEELFFRGYIQTRLASRWRGWIAILVTAALFGAMHFDLIHTPFALLAGLYLGWIAERSGSVVPSLAAHCVNNLCSALGSRLLAGTWYASAHAVMLPVAVVVGGAALCALVLLHRRRAAGQS